VKSVIVAMGFLVSLISPVFAQSGDPIQQDLAGVLKALSEQISRADLLVARLRDTAKKGPVEAQLEVTKAATALGQLADRLQDEGDVMSQLRAIKKRFPRAVSRRATVRLCWRGGTLCSSRRIGRKPKS
jgi:hypothetical protein